MRESLTLTDEDDDEKIEQDKKKSKERSDSTAKIGASVLEKRPARGAEQTKMNPLDKLLASLLPEKDSKTKQSTKAESILAELDKPAPEAVETLEPDRELLPNELNGGEVIIDLRAEDAEDIDDGELTVTPQSTEAVTTPTETVDEPEDATQTTGTTVSPRKSTGGSGGSKTPPPPKPTPSSPPPQRPTRLPYMPLPPTPNKPVPNANFNTVPAAAENSTLNQILEHQRELEHAAYYGRRHGRVEGLMGGIIIGGFFENIRNKSRERKMEKQIKQQQLKQEKRVDSLEFQHNLLKTEQLELVRKQEAERYERKAAAKQELATVARAQMSEAEAIRRAQEVSHIAEESEREKASLIERLNAQAAHQEQLEAENLLLNPENRIETSAWHTIEVDKAGHAVQDTNIEYGHEYYQERGHESGPKDVTTRDSMTGAAALNAATTAQPMQSAPQSNPPAPSMVGMPPQPAYSTPDDTYSTSSHDAATTDAVPRASAAVVIVLLITLTVVGLLIFALM